MSNDQRTHAALRPEHAFVVQFGPATQVDAGQVEGRVEHLVSRQATRFQSLETLLRSSAACYGRSVRRTRPRSPDLGPSGCRRQAARHTHQPHNPRPRRERRMV
jgi:hypothetical protein